MEHVDALKFDQKIALIQELKKQDSQLQALKVMILAGWLDTKDEIPLCIREYWSETNWQFTMGLSSEETMLSFQKHCNQKY